LELRQVLIGKGIKKILKISIFGFDVLRFWLKINHGLRGEM
jgi:hypothetical protein